VRVEWAEVAQSVEQRTENPRVGGSIPSLGTIESTSYSHDNFQKPSTLPVTLPVSVMLRAAMMRVSA
jgi:hypothetical protein